MFNLSEGKVAVFVIFPTSVMVLLEIHQRFKGHFLNESRISFKYIFLWTEIVATATTATLNFSFIIQEIFSWLISEEWEVRNGEQLSQGNLQILVLKRSCSEVFYKKVVLRNFAKFTGKHLYQSLILKKVAGFFGFTRRALFT